MLRLNPHSAEKFKPAEPDPADAELCIEVDGVFITLDEHGENFARKLWWDDFWAGSLTILTGIGIVMLGIWLIKG